MLTQANIFNVLKRIKKELGTSFILITHDIATSSELTLGETPAEVEGLVSMDGNPLAELSGMGKRGLGPLGGASMAMLGSAAEIAGVQLARQALEILA